MDRDEDQGMGGTQLAEEPSVWLFRVVAHEVFVFSGLQEQIAGPGFREQLVHPGGNSTKVDFGIDGSFINEVVNDEIVGRFVIATNEEAFSRQDALYLLVDRAIDGVEIVERFRSEERAANLN